MNQENITQIDPNKVLDNLVLLVNHTVDYLQSWRKFLITIESALFGAFGYILLQIYVPNVNNREVIFSVLVLAILGCSFAIVFLFIEKRSSSWLRWFIQRVKSITPSVLRMYPKESEPNVIKGYSNQFVI